MNSAYPWARAMAYGTSEETSIVLDRANYDGFERWPLESCEPILDWPADAAMSCGDLTGDRTPDDVVPNAWGLHVVSLRLKDVLTDVCGLDCAQYLAVRLDYRGRDLGVFYVVNYLRSVAALDRERSRFTVYTRLDVTPFLPGSIKTIKKAVLTGESLRDAPPMFRLVENQGWVIFSPILRARLVDAAIAGFEFKDIDVS